MHRWITISSCIGCPGFGKIHRAPSQPAMPVCSEPGFNIQILSFTKITKITVPMPNTKPTSAWCKSMQVAFSFKGIQVFKPVKENDPESGSARSDTKLGWSLSNAITKYVKCIHLRLSICQLPCLPKGKHWGQGPALFWRADGLCGMPGQNRSACNACCLHFPYFSKLLLDCY